MQDFKKKMYACEGAACAKLYLSLQDMKQLCRQKPTSQVYLRQN